MSVAYFLLLSSLGLVINSQAQDCSVPVGGDNMALKGNDILLQTFPNGAQATFECNPGYVSAGGSPSITCTDGTWSPVKLKCEKRNCGSAGHVANGNIDYSEGTEFGAKLVVTCNTGYGLVGRREIFCGVQGWMGRLPVCEVDLGPADPTVSPGNNGDSLLTYLINMIIDILPSVYLFKVYSAIFVTDLWPACDKVETQSKDK